MRVTVFRTLVLDDDDDDADYCMRLWRQSDTVVCDGFVILQYCKGAVIEASVE